MNDVKDLEQFIEALPPEKKQFANFILANTSVLRELKMYLQSGEKFRMCNQDSEGKIIKKYELKLVECE